MDEVVFVLSVLQEVVERNGVALDSNFFDQVTKLSIGTLAQVGKQTVLELVILLHVGVVGNLVDDSVAEDVLVSEHVTHSALVSGHALLVCKLHCLLVVHVAVLHGVICLF